MPAQLWQIPDIAYLHHTFDRRKILGMIFHLHVPMHFGSKKVDGENKQVMLLKILVEYTRGWREHAKLLVSVCLLA